MKDKTERLIDVNWNSVNNNTYPTSLFIETVTGKNYIIDIMTKATMQNIIIDSFNIHENNNASIYEIIVKIKNTEELNKFITSLEMLDFIKRVSKTKF